jgi:hypothetical protein
VSKSARCAVVPRASFDLQREADEAEAALADELVEIDEALHVREAEVAADVMDFEIVASRPPRAHGLDTKHADTLPAEPGGRIFGQARKVGQIPILAVAAAVKVHVQQHGVLRLDGHPRRFDRCLEVGGRDVGLQRLVGEIETDGLGKKMAASDEMAASSVGAISVARSIRRAGRPIEAASARKSMAGSTMSMATKRLARTEQPDRNW